MQDEPLIKTNSNITITDASPVIAPKRDTRWDGWSSLQKGIGTSKDFRTSASFISDYGLSISDLLSLYEQDGLVARIVDVVADDIFRPWGTVQNDKTDKYNEGEIIHTLNRLEAKRYLTLAKRWARLTGGALVFVGAMDSSKADQPLNSGEIGSIEFLKVFDLGDILTGMSTYTTDETDPNFGNIETYMVKVRVGTQVVFKRLHHTRCIAFPGKPVPPSGSYTLDKRYWGESVLQGMYSDIKDYRLSFSNTAGIIGEFLISKYKFADLDELLAQGNEKKLQARISGIEMSKSLIHAVMLGTDEDYVRDSASVAGLADLLDRFMMQVSSVSGIPVTRLFGRSASGLNATGEGDMKSYYDVLASEQQAITPEVERLVRMVASWKGYDKDMDLSWQWGNFNQLTSEQIANEDRIRAETVRTKADAAQRAVQEGMMTPEQAFNWVFKDQLPEQDAEFAEEELNEIMEEQKEAMNATIANRETKEGKSELTNSTAQGEL